MIILAPVEITWARQQSNIYLIYLTLLLRHETCVRINYRNHNHVFTSPNKKVKFRIYIGYKGVCPGFFKPDALPPPKKKKTVPPQSEEFKPTSWRSGHEEPNLFLYFQSPTNTVNFCLQFRKGFEEGF